MSDYVFKSVLEPSSQQVPIPEEGSDFAIDVDADAGLAKGGTVTAFTLGVAVGVRTEGFLHFDDSQIHQLAVAIGVQAASAFRAGVGSMREEIGRLAGGGDA